MKTFKEFGLNSKIIKSLDDLGFVEPTPVQEKVIPFILEKKKDLIALAQTGTGKTAAFALPILNQIKAGTRDLQAIILCPTRELCLQISQDIKILAKYSKDIAITPVYGGEKIDIQIRALRQGTNIVVGTPGRVHDLIRRKNLKLQNIKWLVLDEADEMLDMGFKDDLDSILKETPSTRQTLLFSATISKSVLAISKNYMKEAEEISVGEKNIGAENVTHEYYTVQARDRFEALKRILDSLPGVYGILFCRTRREAGEIADKLKQSNYDAEALHGEISQSMRTKIMDRFKKKHVRLLVATDVAARGIDVSDLTHVINYNLPDQDEAYTHRTGRTGRAQKSGVAISILTSRDLNRVRALENNIGKKFEHKKIPTGKEVCEKQIDNFIKEIETTDVASVKQSEHFLEIAEKLKKMPKEDLIKLFLASKFNNFMDDYKDARDLNTRTTELKERKPFGASANLKINIGRKNGFDVPGLFSLINSNKKLKGLDIGGITLNQEYTIFSVPKAKADEVIKNLQDASFRGKKISIRTSNEAPKARGPRRDGPSRGPSRGPRGGARGGSRGPRGGSGGGYKGKSAYGARPGRNFKRSK